MKKASIFIFQIIFLMAASVFVAGCQGAAPALTPANTAVLTVPSATPTVVIDPVFTPTPEKNYEVLSPTSIRKDNILFEISGRARPGYLQIFFKASATELPESYAKGNLVEQLVFEPSTTPTLVLEFSGGGGGFGTDGSEFMVNQEFGYTVSTPLTPGQILLIVVSATFNQYTGLANPIEFRLEIPVGSLPAGAGGSEVVVENTHPTFDSESVHGIVFRASNPRLDADSKKLVVDLCYDLLEPREWSIGDSTLYDSNGRTAQLRELALLEFILPPVAVDGNWMQEVVKSRAGGQGAYFIEVSDNNGKGRMCAAAAYLPQPGFDISNFRVVVDSLVRYPYENEACDPAYQDRVQKALDERRTGVEINIEKETWRVETAEGQYSESEVCRVAIAQKPDSMSEEQAMALVNQVHSLRGPWTMDVSAK